jgi:hypothetical protein
MKLELLLIAIFFITGTAFASSFTTQTGKGYFSWNNQPISYYSFSPNSTFNLIDGITATDTNGTPSVPLNQQEFNSYICNRQGTTC